MRYAGFADEVSVDIDQQISALRALGWPGIEMRLVGKGRNFDDVTDAEFEAIREKLDRAGIRIVAYGSQIANWSRKISGSFDVDVAELRQIMPRMQKTGTQIVRIMSYPNDGWAERDWRAEVVRRLRELSRMAEANGIILGHENCDGWAGQGPEATLACLADVGSPALRLIFDTGNPVAYGQDVWAYYQAVREHIVHVHIKDYVKDASVPGGYRAVFPGQGGRPCAGHRGGPETDGLRRLVQHGAPHPVRGPRRPRRLGERRPSPRGVPAIREDVRRPLSPRGRVNREAPGACARPRMSALSRPGCISWR